MQSAQRQVMAQLESVWDAMSALSAKLLAASSAPAGSKSAWSSEASQAAVAECDRLSELNVEINEFVQRKANEIAVANSTANVEEIKKALFGNYSCEAVLLALSDVYATCSILDKALAASQAGSADKQGAEQWTAPDNFKRSTTKYWVKNEDTMKVMTTIIKHLPLLVYGRREGGPLAVATAAASDSAPAIQPEQLQAALQSVGPVNAGEYANASNRVSSVYFDSLGPLETYHTRLAREDDARVVRIRWYGEADPTPADAEQGAQVFIECKTHREGAESTKDRAPLRLSQLQDYLANKPLPGVTVVDKNEKKVKRERAKLLSEVQQFLAGANGRQQQEPVLRTDYRRAAFQRSDNNDVRVSIDMSMSMVCELDSRNAGNVSSWCRSPMASGAAPPPGANTAGFPYAVLEVKLGNKNAKPAWVKELLQSGLLCDAGKFSKFEHGCVMLYPTLIKEHPFWFVPCAAAKAAKAKGLGLMTHRAATMDELVASFAMLKAEKKKLQIAMEAKLATAAEAKIMIEAPKPDKIDAQAQEHSLFTPPTPGTPGTPRLSKFGMSAEEQQQQVEELTQRLSAPRAFGSIIAPQSPMMAKEKQAPMKEFLQIERQHSNASSAFGNGGRGFSCADVKAFHCADAKCTTPLACANGFGPCTPFAGSPLAFPGTPIAAYNMGMLGNGANFFSPHFLQPQQIVAMNVQHQQQQGVTQEWLNNSVPASPRRGRACSAEQESLVIEVSDNDECDGAQKKGRSWSLFGKNDNGEAVPLRSRANTNSAELPSSTEIKQRKGKKEKKGKKENKAKEPKGPDAKTLFSAERTFLNWMSISCMVMLTALGLMSTTECPASAWVNGWCPGAIGGAAIAPIGLVLMAYSLATFRWRTAKIVKGGKDRFDDQRGPIMLVFILVIVMFAAFGLAMYASAVEAKART